MAADNLALIDEFCDSLWLEDGLSKNTLEAYRRDMRLFAKWLASQRPALGGLLAGNLIGLETALGLLELLGAEARELHALLEFLDGGLEGHLARLELRDDLFELLQALFKRFLSHAKISL